MFTSRLQKSHKSKLNMICVVRPRSMTGTPFSKHKPMYLWIWPSHSHNPLSTAEPLKVKNSKELNVFVHRCSLEQQLKLNDIHFGRFELNACCFSLGCDIIYRALGFSLRMIGLENIALNIDRRRLPHIGSTNYF